MKVTIPNRMYSSDIFTQTQLRTEDDFSKDIDEDCGEKP